MSPLETTYYIIGIICMSLITLILIGLIIVAVMIKTKVTHIQRSLQDKVRPLTDFVDQAEQVARRASKQAKKIFQK